MNNFKKDDTLERRHQIICKCREFFINFVVMEICKALYLLPVNLSDAPPRDVLPSANFDIMSRLKFFIVENKKTAIRFLKKCNPAADIDAMTFYELNRHTDLKEVSSYLEPLRQGYAMGVMSDAGCPGVADPGALAVGIAQSEGLRVIPLVGPSSILMSLMASGFNGQSFSFHGYLPIDGKARERKIKELEDISRRHDVTQIFIETPYRNGKMLSSLLSILNRSTRLCVAADITDPDNEFIVTKKVGEWKDVKIDIDKRPAIFLLYAR